MNLLFFNNSKQLVFHFQFSTNGEQSVTNEIIYFSGKNPNEISIQIRLLLSPYNHNVLLSWIMQIIQ